MSDDSQEPYYLAGLIAALRGPVKLDCEHQFRIGHQLTWRCDHCEPLTPEERERFQGGRHEALC